MTLTIMTLSNLTLIIMMLSITKLLSMTKMAISIMPLRIEKILNDT
jgi:hypothetical protein